MKVKLILLAFIILLSNCASKNQKNDIDNIVSQNQIDTENNLPVETNTIIPEENSHSEGYSWYIPLREEYDPFSKDQYAHIRNKTCAKILELYEDIIYAYIVVPFEHATYGVNYDDIHNAIETIPKLLVDYLKTEESWSADVKKELPFIHEISASEDNMVRIYSWDYRESATGDTFNCIIQYKAESGTINAVQLGGFNEHADQLFEELGFRHGPSYWIGFKIEEQAYLIWSHARAGGFMSSASFLAIKLLDGEIEPYLAFNGDNRLEFSVGIQFGGIISNFDIQFEETPFWIKILFNLREDPENYSQWTGDPDFRYAKPYTYDILEFTFNGTEFLGDYTKFNEIKTFRNTY